MRFRQVVSLLLLAMYLPSCANYQQTTQSLPELTAPPEPVHQVRVTLTSGARVQVTSPRVESDTLRGTEGLSRTSGPPVAIPLSDITAVEVVPPSGMSRGAKFVLIALSIGAAVAFGAWLASAGLTD